MMKKTTQTLLLVFSTLLLLVSVTVSAQGQPTPRPTPGPDQGRLRGNSAGFAGRWNTVTDKGKKFVISLEQVRSGGVTGVYGVSCLMGRYSCLTGSYKPSAGSTNGFVNVSWSAEPVPQSMSSIKGTVTGNVLRFTWAEDGSQGAGRFTLSSDGESFEGTFSTTSNPDDTSGGTWNGTRVHSFAGAWQGKMGGEKVFTLVLQQDASGVTGQLLFNAELTIRDGHIVGNTLSFKIVRAGKPLFNGRIPPDEYFGSGELVMERGGKSFTGTILGAAASGTLVGSPGQR